MQQLYDEYAILEAEIKERELKKEQLRPLILKQLVDNGLEKVETSLGKFSKIATKKWTYPEAVVELGEEFKAAKAKAESTGEATFEETDSFRFTITKL